MRPAVRACLPLVAALATSGAAYGQPMSVPQTGQGNTSVVPLEIRPLDVEMRMRSVGNVCRADDASFTVADRLFRLSTEGADARPDWYYRRAGADRDDVACLLAAWGRDMILARIRGMGAETTDVSPTYSGGPTFTFGPGDGVFQGGQGNTAVIVQGDGSTPGPITPTRGFLGPHQFPPQGYRGYGLLAFPSIAVGATRARHRTICQAFMAAMVPTGVSSAPRGDQFLTAFPLASHTLALQLNASDAGIEADCDRAIDNYGQETAQRMIRAARDHGANLSGRGPFLLAWSPAETFSDPEPLVLALDLSRVDSFAEAQALMEEWKSDIQEDFAILTSGFSVERLRVKIRRWADTFGEDFLVYFGG